MTKPRARAALANFGLLVLAVLAGCISHAPPSESDLSGNGARGHDAPDLTSPTAETDLPSIAEVDLEAALANITFPEGQPSAVLVMEITETMWVRPKTLGGFGGVANPAPRRDDTLWALCVWMEPIGLPPDAQIASLAFWLDGDNGTRLAAGNAKNNPERSGASPGGCLYRTDTVSRRFMIQSPRPIEGRLALVLTAFPHWPIGNQSLGAFSLHLGIASEPCASEETENCPPPAVVSAEPQARGPPAVNGLYSVFDGCTDNCGFHLVDLRPAMPDDRVSVGEFTVQATSTNLTGLAWVRAIGTANAAIEVELASKLGTVVAECQGGGQPVAEILAPFAAESAATIAVSSRGIVNHKLEVLLIPVDLAPLGQFATPMTATFEGLDTYGVTNAC